MSQIDELPPTPIKPPKVHMRDGYVEITGVKESFDEFLNTVIQHTLSVYRRHKGRAPEYAIVDGQRYDVRAAQESDEV